jgi:formylglycine-generating enzyme required for sulfatase activity
MAHKLFSLVVMLVLALPVVIFAFAEDESKAPMPAEIMQKQIADAIKVYGEKKEIYRKDVLDLFERKEKNARDKGDLKTLNLIKKQREIFSEDGKEPTLFLITDQKRFLELAKLDLIKAYEKTIKDCLKMKLDVEAEGFSKELEEIRAGKIKVEEKKAKPVFLEAPFSAEAAKNAQKELAKSLGKLIEAKIDLGNGVKLEMMLIPAGKFMMGSPASEVGRFDNETQHEVTLTKPLYMGKYEVTQEQWQAVMGNNPSETKGINYPVTNISWNDGQDYLRKLNAKVNGGYRLPTEAEWEYACRAGTITAYSFGDAITIKDANHGSGSKSVAVGSYKPNPFGLYDMHGNVWEWCEDWLGAYSKEVVIDPKGPETGKSRVLRGGFSFPDFESIVRSSYRSNDLLPNGRYGYNGFRLALTAEFKVSVALPVPKSDPPEVTPGVGDLLIAPFTESKAKELQKAVAKSLQKEVAEKIDLGKGVKLEMVLIPAGKFMMGSPASEKGRNENETQHEVTLTKPFYMGKYEVTQEQWQAVMGNNSSSRTKEARLPVTNVSWLDCQEFIKKLNAKTSGGYRLPKEAEWEYACRAGTTTVYSFGDKITPQDANFLDSRLGAASVGRYKPNAFGLFDMHGNVWEWSEDWFGDYPAGLVIDPKGPVMGETRVLRGGSFAFNESLARSSIRGLSGPPAIRVSNYGFRLARTP